MNSIAHDRDLANRIFSFLHYRKEKEDSTSIEDITLFCAPRERTRTESVLRVLESEGKVQEDDQWTPSCFQLAVA